MDLFSVNWELWAPKILSYAKAINKSSTKDLVELLSTSNVAQGTCMNTNHGNIYTISVLNACMLIVEEWFSKQMIYNFIFLIRSD